MSTPILPFAVWQSGTNENSIPANDNSLRNEILNGLVISRVVTAQPGSPNNGDIYILPPGKTGTQWATFSVDDLVIYKSGTWYAYTPTNGVFVNIDGGQLQFDGSSGWVSQTALTNPMTTEGDLIVGGSGGTPTRLAVGTNGQVLTVTGGVPAWGAGGGGGLTNWTDAVSTAAPNATIPVVSLTATNAATNVDAAILPKGNGAFSLHVADSTSTGGNKRGRNSIDLQTVRSAAGQVAAADRSVVIGANNTVTSGSDSGYAIGFGNTIGSSSTYAGALGQSNTVGPNANYSQAVGTSNTITARYSFANGNSNTCSGEASFTYGQLNTVDAFYAQACGMRAHSRGMLGARAYATGQFAATGDAQERSALVRISTTNATPARLTSDAGAAGTGNQLILSNSSAYIIRGDVVARENATGDCKTWEYRVTMERGANAASTAIVGSAVVTVADADAGAAAWTIAITADTTNGGLAITATGEAAKSIKWVGKIRSVEVVG